MFIVVSPEVCEWFIVTAKLISAPYYAIFSYFNNYSKAEKKALSQVKARLIGFIAKVLMISRNPDIIPYQLLLNIL